MFISSRDFSENKYSSFDNYLKINVHKFYWNHIQRLWYLKYYSFSFSTSKWKIKWVSEPVEVIKVHLHSKVSNQNN